MTERARRVATAFDVFDRDQILALIWVSRDGVVEARIGEMIAFINAGATLVDVLPMFVGLDEDLAAIARGESASLDLPNMSLPAHFPLDFRLNLSVRWQAQTSQFVILVMRALAHAELELELQRQSRARRLAETILIEQAEDIRATNEALAAVNRDLAEFTHVVSHDLKAPMRALRYFTDDLESSLAVADTDGAMQLAARMRAQSRRMTAMLSSLLAYAKLDQKDAAATLCDLERLIGDVVASLPRPVGVGIAIEGQWPEAFTVGALLDVVLRNLLDNAIRHAVPDVRAVVASCRFGSADHLVFEITDNGPGIPDDCVAAVFQPFTTLATPVSSDDAGLANTGMGLALVKRAVDRVEGRISVGPRRDGRSGACFALEWPATIESA